MGSDGEYIGAEEVTGFRLVVIGAGPIGLASALGGLSRKWEVTVLEKDEVGASIRRWGPVRFFSPLAMNLSPGMSALLDGATPPDDALLTGPEFVDGVLLPLAHSDALAGRIKTGHRVVAVGRSGLTRGDFTGHPIRSERPFRLLVETPDGEEAVEADAVIDASGVYGLPVALEDNGRLRVTLGGDRIVVADEVVGLTGYRPDLSFLSELTLEISPATEGSARLARALSNVTDCLSVPSVAPADLDSGEPGFHLAGAKSYGRARTFLLKSGYAQVEAILNRLT